MSRAGDARRYRFEPLDSSGVFLGLGVIQSALLGGGLVTSAAALSLGVPLALAAVPAVGGATVSFARVRSRRGWEWLHLALSWGWARVGGRHRWHAPLPLTLCNPDANATGEPQPLLPPVLAGLEIVTVVWRGRPIGAVHDRETETLSVLVPVTGPQFVVAEPDEQERLLAGWGDTLAGFATEGGPVTHLSWSDFAQPSGMAEHQAWYATRPAAGVPEGAAESYRELLGDAAARATAHDVLITLSVAAGRLTRRQRRADPATGLERALTSSMDGLTRALRSAGLSAGEPLAATGIQRLLRRRLDPTATRPSSEGGRLVERLGLVTPASSGPLAVEAAWSHLRVDGSFHRSFWVASWPRLAVPPSWLEPFLAATGITRTVTVVFTPVPAHQSRRRIERDLVKLDSDAATKTERGRRVDARHRRATTALLEREEELTAGHAEMGYVGLVTVSAGDLDTLDDHSEILESLAREAGLELRALDARHDIGFAAALPLGLAPKTLLP